MKNPACLLAAVILVLIGQLASVHAANFTNVFIFQQGNLTKDGVSYGSGSGYSGVLDGRITDNSGAAALSTSLTATIGNQFLAAAGTNGQQHVGLFSYDLTELNNFIVANTSPHSSASIASVTMTVVAASAASGGAQAVSLFGTDPFTSSATWSNTDGTVAWTVPFQNLGSPTNTQPYCYTGGGSALTPSLGGANPLTTVGAGNNLTWTTSANFINAVSNALFRADKKLYLTARVNFLANGDARLNVITSATNTVASRPQLQITLVVTNTGSNGPITWTGGSSTSWAAAGNWSPSGVPGLNAQTIFNASSTAFLNTVLNENFSISNLTVTSPTGPVSIGGANTLTINAGGIDLSAANQDLTITAPMLLGAPQSWNVASGRILNISGAVSGSGLTVAGAGKVSVGAPNILPNGAAGNLALNGTLDLNGNNQAINALSGTGAVTNSGSAATLTVGLNNSGSTFAGAIQGAASLTKMGTNTLVLTGASSHTGNTTISNGTLMAAHANALGSASGGTIVTSGASLALTNGITLSGEPITINGTGNTGANQNGALRTVDPANPVTVACPITMGSAATIAASVAGGRINLTGTITDNGNNYTLSLLSGSTGSSIHINTTGNTISNVYLYTFRNNAGLISFDVNNVFTNALLYTGGGLFDLNGTSQKFAGLSFFGGVDANLGYITNSSPTLATLDIDVGGANSYSMQSSIQGAVNFVKNGTGTQTFSGTNNSYSGTTVVNAGELALVGNMSQVTNNFTVNNGGTLHGPVTIGGSVTINSGGLYYPGFTSNQVRTATMNKDLTLNPGSTTIVCINPDLSPSNSVINVNGTLTYGGTLVVYSIGHTNALKAGQTFRIFPPGGLLSFGATNFNSIETQAGVQLSFADGLVTVVAAPAPTMSLTALGGSQMQIDWSSSFFKLQYQTNGPNTGLNNNWVDYPPTNGVGSVTWSNNPVWPTTFFRTAPKP